MKTLLLTILLLSFGQAQAVQSFESGSDLLEECEAHVNNTNVAKGNVCVGYIHGIADTHATFTSWKNMTKKWCAPKGIHSSQLVRVVTKYLQKHPEKLHLTASSLVAHALYIAFPCEEIKNVSDTREMI